MTTNKKKKYDKILFIYAYCGIKGILLLLMAGFIIKVLPYFTSCLQALAYLIKNIENSSPEFKLILIMFSLFINIYCINLVANILFKLNEYIDGLKNGNQRTAKKNNRSKT